MNGQNGEGADMKHSFNFKKYNKVLAILFIILCFICILFLFSMRLTPVSALKANSFIGKDIKIIQEVDLDLGKVYIVDTPEAFRTAFVEKHGILWSSPVSFYSNKEQMAKDKIKTIGYMSYTNNEQKQVQLLGIWNEDPEVASIHITKEDGEIYTQSAPLNELIVFKWDEVFNVNATSIVGLNQEGKPLYYYGYPEGTNILRDSEFKWHAVTK